MEVAEVMTTAVAMVVSVTRSRCTDLIYLCMLSEQDLSDAHLCFILHIYMKAAVGTTTEDTVVVVAAAAAAAMEVGSQISRERMPMVWMQYEFW